MTKICTSYHQLYTLEEGDNWKQFISASRGYDFYHTYDYHKMEAEHEPQLFVYREEDIFIAFPLIKRSIEGTDYFDYTSTYGYPGPVSNIDFAEIPVATRTRFIENFQSYALSNKVVSVFTRLNPFSNQSLLLDHSSKTKHVGRTVAIDLKTPLEDQHKKYRRAIRMKINQLRRNGYAVKIADTEEEVNAFSAIYNENMHKLNAAPSYFYNTAYFKKFLRATDYKATILLAYFEDEPVAGAIITFTNKVAQLHLAATANDHLKASPMKLLYDEASIYARNHQMDYLHLGSGVGGREDSLFHFKTGFSDTYLPFHIWCHITDAGVYRELAESRHANAKQVADHQNKLFPIYRSI